MNYTITNQGPFEIHVVSGGGGGSHESVVNVMLEQCKWQKNLNQLILPWNKNFPQQVVVHNPKTDSFRIYSHLRESDPRNDQDGWDGEQMVYKTLSKTNNAEYLVLYHTS